jgi:cytochrome c
MDTFELNKVLGAVLATCLGLQALHLFAGTIFAEQIPAKPGYEVAVKEETPSGGAAAPKEPEKPIEERLASADADRGKSVTRVCQTCHTFEKGGPNRIGPNLWGVVERQRASEAGYGYSAAMKAKGGKWDFGELDKFLTHPQSYIPGTKMTFAGVQSDKQRADLIAYLRTLADNPVAMPKQAAAPASPPPGDQKPQGGQQQQPDNSKGG